MSITTGSVCHICQRWHSDVKPHPYKEGRWVCVNCERRMKRGTKDEDEKKKDKKKSQK